MRILYNIHLYPPTHLCGGEFYIHNINKFLVSRGHEVRVVLNQAAMHNVQCPYDYEGVRVFAPLGTADQYNWAHLMITHLDFTQTTIQLGQIMKKPVVFISHNDIPYECVERAGKHVSVIYNSHWMAKKLAYDKKSTVFEPPVNSDYYNVSEDPFKNEFITLINLDENKGGWILERLAKALPNKKFLGITGSYSEPSYYGQKIDQPSNVTILPKQVDIRPIYKQTRILLMLSRYESWGMTATEAMCSGIPVICTPTPGLQENCAEAGIFIPARGPLIKQDGQKPLDDRDTYDIGPLVKAINKLDNKKYYKTMSDLARKRALELDPKERLYEVESFLFSCVASNPVTELRHITMI